jgi:hypothetical protein
VQTNSSAWVDPGNAFAILTGNNRIDASVIADSPLYQTAEQRVKISVESHLPVASNILVSDEKESVDRTISERFFESKLESTVHFDSDGTFDSQQITSNVYSGQYSFIKKSDRPTQWHKLMTAYELRYFRFHIYLTYRVYNAATDTWYLVKDPLDIPTSKYWSMQVRFISDT